MEEAIILAVIVIVLSTDIFSIISPLFSLHFNIIAILRRSMQFLHHLHLRSFHLLHPALPSLHCDIIALEACSPAQFLQLSARVRLNQRRFAHCRLGAEPLSM